jgi:hypothetical protein
MASYAAAAAVGDAHRLRGDFQPYLRQPRNSGANRASKTSPLKGLCVVDERAKLNDPAIGINTIDG